MKKKVIVLSDHALSTSGVGTQTRHLINGMISKGEWTFRQFGAAIKHSDYRTISVNEDFIIKPIDGFGNRDLIRLTLATEKPDLLLIFTDPRFFTWLFEMEDEVHQICPIAWWHVWDNEPYPAFNDYIYNATDLINCHSHHTYTQLKDRHPGKVNYIPHAVPKDMFFPLPQDQKEQHKKSLLGNDRLDHFVGIWVNRNAKRKRPNDVLESWAMFLADLQSKHGHKKASLIMHTDPLDNEGPNLYSVAEAMGIQNNIIFSKDRLDFDKMNILYNISDFCLNISFAEGFGLGTLEAMNAGLPVIASKTGGLTRQVVDYRDGTHNGIALDIDMRTLVGSQAVPYIYEDYTKNENIAKAMTKLFNMTSLEKSNLRLKVQKYAHDAFSYDKTIQDWHDTANNLISDWKSNKRSSYTVNTL